MPHLRSNNAQEILKRLVKLYKYVVPSAGGLTDALSENIAAGAASILVDDFASWQTGDYLIIVGSGGMDLLQLGAMPGVEGAIPLVGRPPIVAQEAGAVLYRAVRHDMGYITDPGTNISSSSSRAAIGAANAGGAIAYIESDTPELLFTWAQRESNLRDIASAFGIDEDAILGTGVANDPYRFLISGDTIGTQSNYCLRVESRKVNNKLQYMDVINAFPEVSVQAAVVGKGTPTEWGCGVKCTAVIPWDQP